MLFGESKRYYIDRRVAERMAANGATSFASYFALLLGDPGEAEQLINSFTVNETYFYREEHQLRCLSRSLLPEIVRDARPGRPGADLVRALLDRRGALFHRDLAAGELAAGRRLQHRDRRLGYRHRALVEARGGRIRDARAVAAARTPSRDLFRAGRQDAPRRSSRTSGNR